MKKIAIITPFLARGGLEKVAIYQAVQLSKYFDVTLIVLDSFIQDYPYNGKMIDINVSLENRNFYLRIQSIFKSIYRLFRIKKKYQYDLVISHGELANFPNIISGGKVIVTIHENRLFAKKDIQGKLVNQVIKFLYKSKNIKKIVTVSHEIKETFLEKFQLKSENIVTIPNPHNLKQIDSLSYEPLEMYDKIFQYPVLINVGRLIYEKGQWYLLKIFKELKRKNQHLKLVILGEGKLKNYLLDITKKLQLSTYNCWEDMELTGNYDVYFLGFQQNPFKFIKNSKLFLLTSISEGLPNTIIESLACGTPVISTNCKSGPIEILFPHLNKKNINLPIVEEYGALMPTFDGEFYIDNFETLYEAEKIWVSTVENFLKQNTLCNKCKIIVKKYDTVYVIKKWVNIIEN